VRAGAFFALAVGWNGTVWAWGDNRAGELGDGTTTDRHEPVQVDVSDVADIAAGSQHSLARRWDGTVVAWGDNARGQLGIGTTDATATPTAVPGLGEVTAIAATQVASFAVQAPDNVYAWGAGGSTGTGDWDDQSSPVPIDAPHTVGLGVGSSGYHMVVVDDLGAIRAWGYNGNGQLGDGTQDATPSPIVVATARTTVALGGDFTVAIAPDGSVQSWGGNDLGELGDGTTDSSLTPVAVSGLGAASTISAAAGTSHALALRSDGTVVAWGANDFGQLGDGTTTSSSTPVVVAGLPRVVAIAAGSVSSYALAEDGTVWTWGANGSGQLGDGTYTERDTPADIDGIGRVVAIAAGPFHAAAVTETGTVLTWGYNGQGQLGDGTTRDNANTPVEVPLLQNARTVAAGGTFTLVQDRDGAVTRFGDW
jgi:alpha-tubulin suppressor-like RCC1 family protein